MNYVDILRVFEEIYDVETYAVMKYLISLLFLSMFFVCEAQKNIGQYKASNGITYQEGDTIKLSRGSAPNGDFLYIQAGSLGMSMNSDRENLTRSFSGSNAVVKKVMSYRHNGADIVYLVVGVGLVTHYWLFIENAIATCEIPPCGNSSSAGTVQAPDKYDQLKKAKELLDQGILTRTSMKRKKQNFFPNNLIGNTRNY